jgi:hypothetical protein
MSCAAAQVDGADDIGALLANPQFVVPLKQLVLAELQQVLLTASSIGSLCMLRARHRDSIGVWFVAQVLLGADIPDIKLTKEVCGRARHHSCLLAAAC